MTVIKHQRLHEDEDTEGPEPLSIVNPVYDPDIVEEEKKDEPEKEGASSSPPATLKLENNNEKSANGHAAGDAPITPTSAGDVAIYSASSPDEADREIVDIVIAHPGEGGKGTEKLLSFTDSTVLTRKRILLILLILLFILSTTLASYFLYHHFHHQHSDNSNGADSLSAKRLIRLRGGSAPYNGLLELFQDGEWGAVCDDGWSALDASVACSELGLGSEVYRAQRIVNTGPTITKNIKYTKFACSGQEESLRNCPHLEPKDDKCLGAEAVYLECMGIDQGAVKVRLVGPDQGRGRLEVFYNNAWGSVCNSFWSATEAKVLCSQLGYSNVGRAKIVSDDIPDANNTPIWLDHVSCLGNETNLAQCRHLGWGRHIECTHSNDVTVQCINVTNPKNMIKPIKEYLTLRLVDGSDRNEGRLEVYHDRQWGSICDDLWGKEDALVACRQLGFSNVSEWNVIDRVTRFQLPPDDQVVWIKDVQCLGSEQNIGECNYTGWRISSCTRHEFVSIVCQPSAPTTYSVPTITTTSKAATTSSKTTTQSTTTTTTRRPTTTTEPARVLPHNTTVRLAYGERHGEGLLLLNVDGKEMSVCDDVWNLAAAQIVCKQLNYTEVIKFSDQFILLNSGLFSHDLYEIWPSEIICNGNETDLSECDFYHHESVCTRNDNVRMSCGPIPSTTAPSTAQPTTTTTTTSTTTSPTTPPTTTYTQSTSSAVVETTTPAAKAAVRLVGGLSAEVGRLEVFIDGNWGTVCNDMWDEEDAQVVCRQLNYRGVNEFMRLTERNNVHVGSEGQPIHLKGLACNGTEEYLTKCDVVPIQTECRHNEDVMMSCAKVEETTTRSPHNDGDIRLVPGPSEGRLETYYRGQWGAVCDEGWDSIDAVVACRQMGYGNVTAHRVASSEFPGLSSISQWWLSEIHCNGTEEKLSDCLQSPVGDNECSDSLISTVFGTSNERIHITCDENSKLAAAPELLIRLVGGVDPEYVGLLQYLVDGQWGTVCNTRWDIDDATVACRQLGYSGVLQYNLTVAQLHNVSEAAMYTRIHAKDMECKGNEETLQDCPNTPIATECEHRRDDVVLSCLSEAHVNMTDTQTDENLRVIGADADYEGRVEVRLNGTWGRVCDQNDWTHENMAYVCYKLYRKHHYTVSSYINSTEITGDFSAGAFHCDTDVASITDCSFRHDAEYLQSCTRDAQVKCL